MGINNNRESSKEINTLIEKFSLAIKLSKLSKLYSNLNYLLGSNFVRYFLTTENETF